jgi:hypothetical protein
LLAVYCLASALWWRGRRQSLGSYGLRRRRRTV